VERRAFHIVGNTGFHFQKGIYWGMPNASSARWAFQGTGPISCGRRLACGSPDAAATPAPAHGRGGVGSGRGRGVGFLGLLGFLGWAEKGDGPLWPPLCASPPVCPLAATLCSLCVLCAYPVSAAPSGLDGVVGPFRGFRFAPPPAVFRRRFAALPERTRGSASLPASRRKNAKKVIGKCGANGAAPSPDGHAPPHLYPLPTNN
jgi:hypothetical protein